MPRVLAGAGDAEERLDVLAADRHDEPPADLELALERLGHVVAAGGDQDRVEGRLVRQAQAAVAADDRDVVVAERVDPLGRRLAPAARGARSRTLRRRCATSPRPRNPSRRRPRAPGRPAGFQPRRSSARRYTAARWSALRRSAGDRPRRRTRASPRARRLRAAPCGRRPGPKGVSIPRRRICRSTIRSRSSCGSAIDRPPFSNRRGGPRASRRRERLGDRLRRFPGELLGQLGNDLFPQQFVIMRPHRRRACAGRRRPPADRSRR